MIHGLPSMMSKFVNTTVLHREPLVEVPDNARNQPIKKVRGNMPRSRVTETDSGIQGEFNVTIYDRIPLDDNMFDNVFLESK